MSFPADAGYILSLLVIVLQSYSPADGIVVSAAVLPHGSMLLDCNHARLLPPGNRTAQRLCESLRQSYATVTQRLVSSKPDVVLLSTPHGISDYTDFTLYSNPSARGHAATDDLWRRYEVTLTLSANLTQRLVTHLASRHNASLLSAFGPPGQAGEPFPLRWAEVIPAYFLTSASGSLHPIEWMILSQPSRRYKKKESSKMYNELTTLGDALWGYMDRLEHRVSVVISADLAHTHRSDGPYGYSPQASPFDQMCVNWANTLNSTYLLSAGDLEDEALSCGYTGLVTLHGILHAASTSTRRGRGSWRTSYLRYECPSYFGMMAASFIPSHI